MLKPQDILVLLKLVVVGNKSWSYNRLAIELDMSPAEVHAACKRAVLARLAYKINNKIIPNKANLEKFIINGLPFVFYVERGEMVRGIPTAFAADPLNKDIVADTEPLPVWPYEEGEIRGMSFKPLYKSAPKAAKNDKGLYELLVLVDAIRGGRAREKKIACDRLTEVFKDGWNTEP